MGILVILGLFGIFSLAATWIVRWLGPKGFVVLTIAPLVGFIYLLTVAAEVFSGRTIALTYDWIPAFGLNLEFALTPLGWILALLITGVGSGIFAYCAWYFSPSEPCLGRFAAVFVAFGGSMWGLVLADNLILLFVFWELTTIFSYLLVGHYAENQAARRSALQALLVTTFGGLAMLVGMVLLGQIAGTFTIHEILQHPPAVTGTLSVAIVLILVGAISKSALIPFHFWLPSAMAAPTPVSAYLHAAAMVKAGIYLVLLLAPSFAHVPSWRPTILILGALTMLVGGWRALRQFDLKLLLAYGTISQLGFIMLVAGVGTAATTLAATVLTVSHALFKAPLFLIVGSIEHATGTRDIRRLKGVAQQMPVTALNATLALASMAGIPPLLGFVAKETTLGALLEFLQENSFWGWWVLLAVLVGSIFTVAYAFRFAWGAFAAGEAALPTAQPLTPRGPAPLGETIPTTIFVVAGLVGGVLISAVNVLLSTYTVESFPTAAVPELALWHGLNLALWLSLLALILGLLMGLFRRTVSRVQYALSPARWSPWLDSSRIYELIRLDQDRIAILVTAATQRGSLPYYIGTILLVSVGVFVLVGLAEGYPAVEWELWAHPSQLVVALVIVAAALLVTIVQRRMVGVLLVSVTGVGTAMMFLLHGAPDLMLTQMLVETLALIILVLVLRRFPARFTRRKEKPGVRKRRQIRHIVLSAAIGISVMGAGAVAMSSRDSAPISDLFPAAAELAGGSNVVNVTLVDMRAWDTFGEISVLIVATLGLLSLIFLRQDVTESGRRARRRRRRAQPQPAVSGRQWLRAQELMSKARRSVIFEVTTRLLFHPMMLVSLYFLFAGHNSPGGGFVAGLMAGLAFTMRYLAGGRYELQEAVTTPAGFLLGGGLAVAAISAFAGILFGSTILSQTLFDLHGIWLIGDIHLSTSLFFDIGVYLAVIGMALEAIRSFGAEIDRQIVTSGDADAQVDEVIA